MEKQTMIYILGTAQDGGYPQLGCTCPNCQNVKTDVRLKRLPSSLGLLDCESNQSFIFDATPEFPEQLRLLNTKAEQIGFLENHLSGIFLTHAHLGHYTGLMYLGKEALNTKVLPVYCTQAMVRFLENNSPWADLIENKNIVLHVIDPNEEVHIGMNLRVKSISVPHRNEHADTVGFLVQGKNKSFFYLPDLDHWDGFQSEFNQILTEVDYIFLDGSFYDQFELAKFRNRDLSEVPHPPIIDTIKLFQEGILKKNQAEIYFTHFNHTNKILSMTGEAKQFIESSGFSTLSEGQLFII